ncbi:hypothetical protein ACLOJK_036067 [Asimina triloba]
MDLLKHDKVLSKKPPPAHLRAVPEYLVDPTTQEASKIVKISRAAMGKTGSDHRPKLNKRFGRSRDPLKTFSAEGRKKSRKSDSRKETEDGEADSHKHKKRRHTS